MKGKINGTTAGIIAGTLVAIGGAIKDSPYEGFKPITFLRSPIVGAIVGTVLASQFKIKDFPVILLSVIGGERIVVETWKIIRAHKPSKFENGEWGIPLKVINNER
ncbi:MAG: hypothetical protein ABGW66_04385 [Flavobacteriaceae bacterium]|jgi:uncharacterized membrane protein YeaQ/YmgE (transglycosylase-associated protein family)